MTRIVGDVAQCAYGRCVGGDDEAVLAAFDSSLFFGV